MTSSTRAIGIDLGTTYSCLAIPQSDGTVTVIPNDQGRLTTPSYVSFIDNQVVVGSMAKSQAVANLENTVFDAKRLMGRFYDDPFVQADKAHWPFKVEAVGNRPKIKVSSRRWQYKVDRTKELCVHTGSIRWTRATVCSRAD